MTVELIEFLLGLYFVAWSLSVTKSTGATTWTKSLDIFKFVFGVVLFCVALYHGVKV